MKSEKGITLIVLMITIAVIIIIASVALRSGTETINNTLLKGFYTQLEIVEKRVDEIASNDENYIDENGTEISIKEAGTDLTQSQKNKLGEILLSQGITTEYINNYRYFTIKDIKDILDLDEIDYNLFIDFENRIVIAEDGITINNTTYYMLKDTGYYVANSFNKDENIDFDVSINEIANGYYKISIIPSVSETVGTIKYKSVSTKYWETSNDLEITVDKLTQYDIKYIYKNSSIQKQYTIYSDNEGNIRIGLNKLVTFTINPTQSDATVTIDGKEGNSITVYIGTTINYTVSKEHYNTQSGSYIVTDSPNTLDITLEPTMVNITINPTPSDATVTIDGETRRSISVQEGETISYTVSKEHYNTKSGSHTANSSQTINVALEAKMVTFTINPTPIDATVEINGKITNSLEVIECSEITYTVSKKSYYSQSGTYTIETSNYTQDIVLVENPLKSISIVPGGVAGLNVNNLTNAKYGHTNTSKYAGGNTIVAVDRAWLWWEFKAATIQNAIKSDNYEIKSLKVQYRIYSTVNKTMNITLYVNGNTEDTAESFDSTTAKSGALSQKLLTYSLGESAVPTASQIRQGVNFEVSFDGSTALPKWYGATLTIEYIEK